MRLFMMVLCLCFAVFSMGMSYAPTSSKLSYNNLSIGDDYNDMIEHFGKYRYTESDYAWGQKLTYYIYKNGNKIAIDDSSKKVVDINIIDDSYERGEKLKMGMTSFKVEKIFGSAPRQAIEGKSCYAYQDEHNVRIILQIEPTDRCLEAIRITCLPVELPADNTEYLPDEAGDESENPMIADKVIDTSAVLLDKGQGGFKIHYNYAITK